MDFTIPTNVAEAALKLLTNVVFLGGASSFLTWALFQVWSPNGENWRRVISNTIPLLVVAIVTPFGAWRHWFDYTDDLLFNAIIGAVAVGWGKDWIYSAAKGIAMGVNKAKGVPNEPGA